MISHQEAQELRLLRAHTHVRVLDMRHAYVSTPPRARGSRGVGFGGRAQALVQHSARWGPPPAPLPAGARRDKAGRAARPRRSTA